MENPSSKVAACAIYFGANGGKFSELGKAILEEDDRLLCGKAFDCGHCEYLHQWVAVQKSLGYEISWECVRCLRKTKKRDDEMDVERVLTGYYQAGQKPDTNPQSLEYDPDRPGLSGCTRIISEDEPDIDKKAGEVCGWESSFLQLVLRRQRP